MQAWAWSPVSNWIHLSQSDVKETREKFGLATVLITIQSQTNNSASKETYIYDGTWVVPRYFFKVKVLESITKIGYCMFHNYISVTSIMIPNSVTMIVNCVFGNCESLTSIVIPNSITTISNGVFRDCTSITSIVITNYITAIVNSVLHNYESLNSIVIPNQPQWLAI